MLKTEIATQKVKFKSFVFGEVKMPKILSWLKIGLVTFTGSNEFN
jgi:hypothetical protein